MTKWLRSVVLVWFAAFGIVGPVWGQAPRAASDFAVMGAAKVLCSAVFTSGRELDEALRNSTSIFLSESDLDLLMSRGDDRSDATITLDREAGTVQVTLYGYTGRAKYYGDQGCVLFPPGFDRVFFEPVSVKTTLPDAMSQPWPMGDRLPDTPLPPELNREKIEEAVDTAFSGDSLTMGFVVVYKGRIVGERYGEGITKDTQLESWSMGKSLTATLLGVLVQQGHVGLHDRAPVASWHEDPEDPRSRIRVSDLLRMSSGLHFTNASQPSYEWGRNMADHFYVYTGAVDAFTHSITRPVEFPPNTVGRYRNCDPLTIGYIIKQTVEELGENYLAWPQKGLFDRIGIRRQVLEPDPYGNFLLTGYDYGTVRNWARLGLLYSQDGVWEGERILPEGWAEFVSTPAPGWNRPVYGGQFWINGDGRWNLPKSTYYMSGAGGQHVFVVPTHDLVVARQGHRRGASASARVLNVALGKIIDAIDREPVSK